MNSSLPAAVVEPIALVDASDSDRTVATFKTDGLVNDASIPFHGQAIKGTEVVAHRGAKA